MDRPDSTESAASRSQIGRLGRRGGYEKCPITSTVTLELLNAYLAQKRSNGYLRRLRVKYDLLDDSL